MHTLHVRTAAADAEPRHKKLIIANVEESNQRVHVYYMIFYKLLPRKVILYSSKQHRL